MDPIVRFLLLAALALLGIYHIYQMKHSHYRPCSLVNQMAQTYCTDLALVEKSRNLLTNDCEALVFYYKCKASAICNYCTDAYEAKLSEARLRFNLKDKLDAMFFFTCRNYSLPADLNLHVSYCTYMPKALPWSVVFCILKTIAWIVILSFLI